MTAKTTLLQPETWGMTLDLSMSDLELNLSLLKEVLCPLFIKLQALRFTTKSYISNKTDPHTMKSMHQ